MSKTQYAASRIVSVARDGQSCLIQWKPVAGQHFKDSREPLRDGHVSYALFAAYFKRKSAAYQHAMSNRLVRRVSGLPVEGQFGVVAKVSLRKGAFIPFPIRSFKVTRVSQERDEKLERNAFQHPYNPDLAIDTSVGSNLQAINSGWNGMRMARRQNIRLQWEHGVLFAVAVESIAKGQELLLSYRF